MRLIRLQHQDKLSLIEIMRYKITSAALIVLNVISQLRFQTNRFCFQIMRHRVLLEHDTVATIDLLFNHLHETSYKPGLSQCNHRELQPLWYQTGICFPSLGAAAIGS